MLEFTFRLFWTVRRDDSFASVDPSFTIPTHAAVSINRHWFGYAHGDLAMLYIWAVLLGYMAISLLG